MNNENNILVAKRYAEALVEFGKSEKLSFVAISTNMANIQHILSKSRDLYDTLVNPLVSIEDKIDLVNKIFANEVDGLILNFLKILVEKNRFDLIDEIVRVYNYLLDDINGIARVEVLSAVELNDVEQGDIQAKLASKLKKQIVIKYTVDKSLIAGLIVKMGDNIIDMSVAHKLEEYKMALIK